MTARTIRNPILTGFNPDPSICRAGDDFFIATSTFEWFPGVQIHHSKDLVNWRLLTRPLTCASQLDMIGNPDSCGIWAPCLSYADGLFWLVYTDVKTRSATFMSLHNYLVTAPDITGPWSEPVYLNASGFDPSLFHDEDGRKWIVNMLNDYRVGKGRFEGILLQEYSVAEKRLVGPIKNIFKGTELGATEGPHLYRHDGTYYLMTAEGGTGYNHAVTMARSKHIEGPYKVDPMNPMLTSRDTGARLQKAGHASFVELDDGSVYLVHLCGRPVWHRDRRYCILGRETAIQKCCWSDDGWLRLADGGNTPQDDVPAPELPTSEFEPPPGREEFDRPELPLAFQSLRVPVGEEWASLKARPGHLRLIGREGTVSRHHQSLLARRIKSFHCEAATCVEFQPESFHQMAGLIALYDVKTQFYLAVTHDEALGRCVKLIMLDKGRYSEPAGAGVAVRGAERVFLKVAMRRHTMRFAWSLGGKEWHEIGPALQATLLSDEYCGGFTGAFVGICCQDLNGSRLHADFDWFEYRDLEE